MPVTKRQFEAAYRKWKKAIKDPEIMVSSRPQDYTDIKEFKALVKLGKGALPFILEKIEAGEFLLNGAALKLARTKMERIVAKEREIPARKRVRFMAKAKIPAFLSEQQKAELIVKHLRAGE